MKVDAVLLEWNKPDEDGNIFSPDCFKNSLNNYHNDMILSHARGLENVFLKHQWDNAAEPNKYGCQLMLPFGAHYILTSPQMRAIDDGNGNIKVSMFSSLQFFHP